MGELGPCVVPGRTVRQSGVLVLRAAFLKNPVVKVMSRSSCESRSYADGGRQELAHGRTGSARSTGACSIRQSACFGSSSCIFGEISCENWVHHFMKAETTQMDGGWFDLLAHGRIWPARSSGAYSIRKSGVLVLRAASSAWRVVPLGVEKGSKM